MQKPSDRGRKALQSLGFSMVAGGGLEPPTSGLWSPTSYQLLYPAIFGAGDRDRTGTGLLHGILSPGVCQFRHSGIWVAPVSSAYLGYHKPKRLSRRILKPERNSK